MPFFPKAVIYLIIAAAMAFFLNREDDRGTFAVVDREYISWLMANSNSEIQEPSVTFLQIDDPRARVFGGWPLGPVDYSILIDNLGKNQPRVIAVEPVLGWVGGVDEVRMSSLRNVLLRMDPDFGNGEGAKVLLGAELKMNPAGKPIGDGALSLFPEIEAVEGDRSRIPEFTQVGALPEVALMAISQQLGFTRIDLGEADAERRLDSLSVPMLARFEDRVVPSFIVWARVPAAGVGLDSVEVVLGDEIRIAGERGLEIPIDGAGRLNVFTGIRERIAKHNADILILMGGEDIRDQLTEEQKASLLSRIVILGTDDEAARTIPLGAEMISRGELFAMAMATIQAERFIEKLPPPVKWGIWVTLAVIGLLLLRLPRRRRAVMVWGVWLILYFVSNLMLFQYTQQWTPLMVPLGIIVSALLVVLLLPATRRTEPAESMEAVEESNPPADPRAL
jgi:hypothetical protein